jgi:hypothetical protein
VFAPRSVGHSTHALPRFREERDPYTGFLDCAKRVIDEEGIGALYRGWWIMLLTSIGPPVVLYLVLIMKNKKK